MIKARLAGLALFALAAYAPAGADPLPANAALTASQPAAAPAVYWPVATARTDWNTISSAPDCVRLRCFEAPRPVSQLDNPRRRHVGIDLFANAGDGVHAIEDGRIVGFYPFLRAATGEMTFALLVAHEGYVANYGEVRENSLTSRQLQVGDLVRAGQNIATVSDTAQLHFETYQPGVTRNQSWANGGTRPPGVVDPTSRLRDLAARGLRPQG